MNRLSVLYKLLLAGAIIFMASCKIQERDNVKLKIKPRPPKFLVKKLKAKEFQFDAIAAKAAVEITDSMDKKTSFKTHLRIKKDSAIWVSITPLLGIEMARVLITKDTVKFLNRSQKEYFIGDFSYINDAFGTDLDYQMLEALLIGNSLDFEEEEQINSRIDRKKELYYLSTIKKRKVRKELKKEKEKIKADGQVIWLDPITFKVKELLLTSSEKGRSLSTTYAEFNKVGEQLIPFEIRFLFQSKPSNTLDINYSKISLKEALSFPFKISSKYVQLQN